MDKDLPFYYYTSMHERFHEGEMPSFDKFIKSTSNPRHQRIHKAEQPGNLALGRATLIKAGTKSVRRQFHQLSVELPPPPTVNPNVTIEHSYA